MLLGGVPPLGYDVDRQTRRLVINHEEAVRVQNIFGIYTQLGGLVPVVEELARRGWVNKQWTNPPCSILSSNLSLWSDLCKYFASKNLPIPRLFRLAENERNLSRNCK